MLGNFYEIDELLNEAVMTGVPSIIVEGIDDISIYSEISNSVPFDVEIYAVESIEGYGEGCQNVINAIKELNALPNNKHRLVENVLGIIDKDVRDFREEMPDVEPILVLNNYSIESHFVSKTIIANTLNLCSKVNRELINDSLCSLIMDDIEYKLLDLYYFSLESLRNSLDRGYESCFSYSYTSGRINDTTIKKAIFNKRSELDIFASNHRLSPCLDTLKSIAKGKWLIDVFSEELLKSINNLQGLCEEHKIETCKSCVIKAFNKCLYRIREGVTKKTVKSLAYANTDGEEFLYIVNRIKNIIKTT